MKRNRIVLFIGVCILFLSLFVLNRKPIEPFQTQDTLFTCTTFFDFKTGDRWDRFCRAIDSLKKFHDESILGRIEKWIVVNEYSETPKEDWAAKMAERYPFVEFIQKGPHQKGQAASMNRILERIHPYTFWIHWEETWEVRKTFLKDAFTAMDTSDITQLQFTFHEGKVNWMDMPKNKIHCRGRICKIDAADGIETMLDKDPYKDWSNDIFPKWPLYSLLPSINRVADYETLGTFSEDPKLWPIKFEWDYARRWYRANCKKAVIKDGPVWRPGKHTSTYT